MVPTFSPGSIMSTQPTPSNAAETSQIPEPLTASIKLRAAASDMQFRFLAIVYLGLMAYAWLPAAVVAAFLLPLFCAPTHPRRALWLWTVGLLAGGMSIMKGREIFRGLGNVRDAFTQDPMWAGLGIGLAALGAGLMLWHLTWIKSPRRM